MTSQIHADNAFKPVLGTWRMTKDSIVKINHANAQEHMPRAERNS